MAYSSDIKRLAIRLVFVEKYTYEQVCDILKIGLTTLKKWLKLHKDGALYTVKQRGHMIRTIEDEALKAYIKEHCDAYLHEIAAKFGVSKSGIHSALKRLGISYKKNAMLHRAERRIA